MKKSFIHIALSICVSVLVWLLVFLGSEYWKINFIPKLTPIFIIGITIFCFLIFFWRGLHDIPSIAKPLIALLLTIITSVIWFTACKIMFLLISAKLSIPREAFSKSVEQFTDLSQKIGSSEFFGFMYAVIIFFCALAFWHSVVFRDGAKKWADSMIRYDKFLGVKTRENDFFLKPIVLKSMITLMFLFSVLFLLVCFKNLLI